MGFVSDFFGDGEAADVLAGGEGDFLDLWGRRAGREAREAAEVQEEQFGQGIAEQRRQFDLLYDLSRPSIEAGDLARQQQLALLGLLGPEAQQQAQSEVEESPAQKFIRDRQQRALLRNASAIGGLGGGNVRSALQEQAAGFAMQDAENQFNRLASLTGGAQVGVGNVGQFGGQATNAITNLLGQQGNAIASGIFGQQQARQQGTNNALAIGGALAAAFSDERLKDNVRKIGKMGDLNIYEWEWKSTGKTDRGFIAQEVKEKHPELVEEHNGFLKVNYEKVMEVA